MNATQVQGHGYYNTIGVLNEYMSGAQEYYRTPHTEV